MERDIVKVIVRSAKASGWWTMKIHGGPYQPAGIPDLLCVKDGKAVWLEVKQPGKKASAIQLQRIAEIREQSGAPCYVVTSREEADVCLRVHSHDSRRRAVDPVVDQCERRAGLR